MKLILLLLFIITSFFGVDLERRNLLDDKIEMLVPKAFQPMSAEMLAFKYPNTGNKPSFVLTDEDATVNIAFNHLAVNATSKEVETYKNSFKASLKKSFPNAEWKGDGVKVINGKKVAYLKLITPANDQRVYNYMFMTDVAGKLLIGTFNCTEKLMREWIEASESMVASLKVK